jgi:hypothetical protein
MWNNPPLIVFLGFSHVDICIETAQLVLSTGLVGLVGVGICGSISMNFNA